MSHAIDRTAALSADNLNLRAGSTTPLAAVLAILGVIAAVVALAAAFAGGDGDVPTGKIMLAAYHAGAVSTLGMTLGCLGFVMILHQVNAGWAALVRRQAENVMALLPVACLLVAVSLGLNLVLPHEIALFGWMDAAYTAGDPIYAHKAAYLDVPFWIARAVFYMIVWVWLSTSLVRMSLKQDRTGDRWLSNKMRRRSSYGLLLFAFTTAFASFDWLMSLDYHWFSTMFGVYFFAQNMGAALSAILLLMLWIRRSGRGEGLATQEHLHDMGKLLFGFCVFWGYIAFSQYFLIWYANLPEETSWFIRRKTGDWEIIAVIEVVARFCVPFVLLIPRPWRRSPRVLAFMSCWVLFFTLFDQLFVVRGNVYDANKDAIALGPLDFVAAAAPMLFLLGLVFMRMTRNAVAPAHDPKIDSSLHHMNYV